MMETVGYQMDGKLNPSLTPQSQADISEETKNKKIEEVISFKN